MITLQKLARKTKDFLKKMLSKAGRAANARLAEHKEKGTWEDIPYNIRNRYENILNENRGRFFVAPREKKGEKRTKEWYAEKIIQAESFIENIPTPDEYLEQRKSPNYVEPVPDVMYDKFERFLAETWSRFWALYNYYVNDVGMSREEAMSLAHRCAEAAEDADEFLAMYASGGVWINM